MNVPNTLAVVSKHNSVWIVLVVWLCFQGQRDAFDEAFSIV